MDKKLLETATPDQVLRPNAAVVWNHRLFEYRTLMADPDAAAYYATHALVLASPKHRVMLPEVLRPDVASQLDHLRRVGLEPPALSAAIWSTEHDAAADYCPPAEYDVYMMDADANHVIANDARLQAAELLNHKNRFIEFCQQRGYAVPETYCYDAGQSPAAVDDGVWFVKAATFASGHGIYRANSAQELAKAAAEMTGDYQVQAEVVGDFINIQYWIDAKGTARFVSVSDQLMDGCVHMGNRFPSKHNPRHVTDAVAQGAAELGARGLVAFDVAVPAANQDQPLVIECNCRWNANSYPTLVAWKLAAPAWRVSKLDKPAHLPRRTIDLGQLEYDPTRRTGVIIMGWTDTRVLAMAVGSPEEQDNLLAAAQQVILS